MRSHKLLALLLCLITGPALAGYMTLLGAGLGAVQPVAQATFINSSYSTNLSNLTSVATFSRAGNATQFDSSGYLTYGPNNLLLNTATLGTQTVTVQVGVNYILSIKGTGSVTLTGASTAGPLNGTGASNRVDLKITAATTSLTLTVSGSVTSARLSAVTYETAFRACDDVDNTASAFYGARFDYTYNGSSWVPAGLLVEGAATNLIPANVSSTGLSGWGTWNATTTAGAATGIDGLTSADRLNEVAASGPQNSYYTVLGKTTNAVYTHAAVLKQGTQRYGHLSLTGADYTDWVAATFDLQTGTVSQSQAGATGTLSGSGIKSLGNGYYLCWVAGSVVATTGYNYIGTVNTGTPTLGNYGLLQYAGNTANYILVSGAQFELGSSPSSLIRQSNSTRPAETVQLTGAALSTALGSVASAFVEVGGLPVQSSTIRYLQYGAGSGILLGMSGGSATTVYEQNTAGSADATAVAGSGSIATTLRAGVSWGSTGGRKLVANGGTVATDASNNELATGTVNLGQGQGTYINGWLRSFAIYNSRLPDATLQAKSVVGASYAANDNGIRYAFADNDNLPIHWRVAL